jgi:PadR family transcriptional regulator, regulatory protein AphA
MTNKFKKSFVNNIPYTESNDDSRFLRKEQDALDIIAVCGEHDTQLVLIYEQNLSSDFFNLATGLAGAFFQKCVNYQVKVAFVIKFDNVKSERFKELISESNKSNHIRFFEDKQAAEKWLTS